MDYSKHFLLDVNTVKQYVLDKTDLFEGKTADEIESKELSDGNINYIYKVFDNDKSVIVKQSDNKIRTSGRKLDMGRSLKEYKILSIEQKLTGMVPDVYDYDEIMSVIIMEDVSKYKNLRLKLAEHKTYSQLANQISTFMVNSLLPTTDLIYDRHEKKRLVQQFTNIDLCDITEDLVLTEPYYDYKGRNVFDPELKSFVEQNLYSNDELKANVGELRNNFMNNAQALLHGDLHSGSIFVTDDDTKVIDPEFAFYGPMGYDIGNVIGNLVFPYVVSLSDPTNIDESFVNWLGQTIVDIYDLTVRKMFNKYNELVEFPLYKERKFKNDYINGIMADTLGYAGTEIIRRTVGDSKVAEISNITDKTQKNLVSRILVGIGTNLILNRKLYSEGKQILDDINYITKTEVEGGVIVE